MNYTIISLIGQGGMGSVYLAEHKYIKQQKVAIKVINKDMVNDFTREKLKEEAEHLASLNHPNIVHFLDYHIDEEGNIYLIMEYAEGLTLDRYIKEVSGLIVESRICPLFEPILDAVEYAHHGRKDMCIIHRDIKPANIVIGEDGQPKILDFGIATIVKRDMVDSDNMVMGTPSYMSPEQVKGEHLDERSDIYALGVVLHQMLTGRAPYDTTTLNEHEINERVVNEPLPRLQTFYKYISDKMQKVVDKATAKNREDRYQSCAEFKKALHNVVYPPKVARGVWIAAALAAVVVLGGALWWWDYNRVKIRYYKDYVEQWGVPQGIGKLSTDDMEHRNSTYRFEYQQRKLRRMTLVNGHGKITDHHDSEHMERSSDMQFYYGDEGKLTYVKILDRSGRVLYKKAYNDKLNTVIFQYDDENGTEFVLNANTLGYFSNPFLSYGNDSKSRISRYLLTYDERGYVTKLEYAAVYNVKLGNQDGIFARAFKHDDKGRVIEECYLGYDGKPKGIKGGLGIKRHTFAENDDWIETCYLTVDGQQSSDAGGVPIVKIEYDKYGNRIKESYVNAQGEFVLRSDMKASGCNYQYNEHGDRVLQSYFGLDGKPCYGSEGVATAKWTFDDNGYVSEIAYYDVDGNPCLTSDGSARFVCRNDEHGNQLEQQYYGLDGKLTLNTNGYARMVYKYNDKGLPVEEIAYDADGQPVIQKNGAAGTRYELNERGLIVSRMNLGVDLKPAANTEGYISYRQEFDVRGNLTKIVFCGADGMTPDMQEEGYAGWNQVYDENGNQIEQTYFDEKGEPCEDKRGEYRWAAEYDEYGNRIRTRRYDLAGKLVLVDGIAGEDRRYDERGNVLEAKPIGLDGGQAKNRLTTRYKYDERDNLIEYAFYDANNKPDVNVDNIHKSVSVYNNRNQEIEVRYYNVQGRLTIHKGHKYAIQRNEFDDRGNLVHQAYLGTDEKPIRCGQGWASSDMEYDGLNRVVRQLFYDVDGKPSNPSVMVPEGICSYDKWGNINYVASADGHGKLINNPNTGWCIKRQVYDLRGNVIEESYFDSKDKPVNSKEVGCHQVKYAYTSAGDRTELAYFNIDGSPSNGLYGYHREVDKYNDKRQLLTMAIYDAKGRATNGTVGFHRIDLTYNTDGVAVTRKFYTAAGALMGMQRWNGSDWVNVEQQSSASIPSAPASSGSQGNWKQMVAELNNELPLDLGDEAKGLIIQSFKVTGADGCQLIFKLPRSKYEISASDMSAYSAAVEMFVDKMKSEKLPSSVDIEGVLYDSKGRVLYRVER